MIQKPAAPRVHWDAQAGWVVDTRFPLTKAMLVSCVKWTIKVQTDRIRAMPPGDRREQAERALKQLSIFSLKVNLLPMSDFSTERILY